MYAPLPIRQSLRPKLGLLSGWRRPALAWLCLCFAAGASPAAPWRSGEPLPFALREVAQQAYAKASNPGAIDHFGHVVALSGDTLVVGAPFEDSAATAIDGDQGNNDAMDAGAVYVFVRSNGVWSQQAYLKASNTEPFDGFGGSVAIDGDTIVVGASGEDSSATGVNGDQSDNGMNLAGAAYVFVRNNGVWTQQAYLKASNPDAFDEFGHAVAISGDTIVVGALFEQSSGLGVGADQNNNLANQAGAAYVFQRQGGIWTQQAYIKPLNTGAGDRFGVSVSIDGDSIAVGAYNEDSNATGINGNGFNNSATNSGAAYVFVRSGVSWSQQAYVKATNTEAQDEFGLSVALHGDTLVVGAHREASDALGVGGSQTNNNATFAGAAFVYARSGTVWSPQAYLKAINTGIGDFFGTAVAVRGDDILVGALREDSNATGLQGNQANDDSPDSGAAYLYRRSGGLWAPVGYIKASNTGDGDLFGSSVALGDSGFAIGATGEDSDATGIDGDQSSNAAEDAGALYFFGVLEVDELLVDGFEG